MSEVEYGEIEPHEKEWIRQSALKMSERELAENILLFLQHSDSSITSREAEIAGYKLYLWAESKEK
jgi:hypothetical protein